MSLPWLWLRLVIVVDAIVINVIGAAAVNAIVGIVIGVADIVIIVIN